MSFAKADKYGLVQQNDMSDLTRYREQIARAKDTKKIGTLEERIAALEKQVAKLMAMTGIVDG